MTRHETIAKIAAMARDRLAARKAERMPRPKKADLAAPTPERAAKGDFIQSDIVDVTTKGRVTIGKAYRLRPRFERIEGLGAAQIKALRYYRNAFDQSEISEVKSALDIGPGGGAAGSHGAITRLEARAFGGQEVRMIERGIRPALLDTLRDVALHDMTFADLAMKRFGARDYILNGVSIMKPRSGKHRQIIRDEFMAGLGMLVAVIGPMQDRKR